MDPSYNNSFGQFGSSGETQAQTPIASGNTGDIVLQQDRGKDNKKRLLAIVIGLIAVLCVSLGIWFVFVGNKTQRVMDKELYDEVIRDSIDQMSDLQSTNFFLEDGLSGKFSMFGLMFSSDEIDYQREKLSGIDSYIEKLQGIKFTDDIRDKVDDVAMVLREYKEVISVALGELAVFVKSFNNFDFVGVEEFVNRNGLSSVDGDSLLKYTEDYIAARPIIEECENNSYCDVAYLIDRANEVGVDVQLLLGYFNKSGGGSDLVRVVFESVWNQDDIGIWQNCMDGIKEVKDMIENQYNFDNGATNE